MMSRVVCAIFLIWLLMNAANAVTFTGKVVAISDGDTFTVLVDWWKGKKQYKVRLAEIDTPESDQPYGQRSKQHLADLIFGKTVTVHIEESDHYRRFIGHVVIGGLYVNQALVRMGAAWVYRKYNRDKSLLAVEAEAKRHRRGIWSLPEADRTPPWAWRREKRSGSNTISSSANDQCGNKTRCTDMASCDEAKFYLNQCGLSHLDGNRDGIPCNSLCR